jgi:hypothetical protein
MVMVADDAPPVTFFYQPFFELGVIGELIGPDPGWYVELRDRNFKLLRILDTAIEAMDWQFDRFGGCGAFNIKLKERFNALRGVNLQGEYDIRIHLPSADGSSVLLWYRGYVDKHSDDLNEKETVSISGMGYGRQLGRVVVAATYINMSVRDIVLSVMSTYVAPKTSILFDPTRVGDAGFVASTIGFNTTADKAIKTLADLVNAEFGVDKNRNFYFVPAGSTVTNRYFIGGDVTALNSPRAYDGIVNRLFIQGKDGLRFTVENVGSQERYGLREQVVVNASISSESVAQQYGQSFLRENARPVRKVRVNVRKVDEPLERQFPIGRVAVDGIAGDAPSHYDDGVLYNSGAIYGGGFSAPPENIRYEWRDGRPTASVQLGNPKDETSKQLKLIEFELDALREV